MNYNSKSFLKSASGFTLIEIMLAILILVVVLCGLLSTYIGCLELASISKNSIFAVNAAQKKIEEIRNYSFSDIYNDYNNTTFTVDEMPSGNSKGVIYVDNSNPDLLKLTVSVCWRQRGTLVVGEDRNLNGVLNTGEDLNGNNMIDSTVQLVTLIANR
jgi:prepilin-type N-terminal cleavage/methylation domain-containing protein